MGTKTEKDKDQPSTKMTEYTELYQQLATSELLTILAEAEKYDPIAVETAKTEIESRNLTEAELNRAKAQITATQEAKNLKVEKRKQREENLKKRTATLWDSINPIQNGIQTPEKIIRLTLLVFGGLALYNLYEESWFLLYLLQEGPSDWDVSIIEFFLPFLLLPIALFLFWKRYTLGWVLLTLFLTYSAFNSMLLFFMNLGRQPSGIPAMEEIFPTVSPAVYAMTLLFFGSFVYLICKPQVRSIFKVSSLIMLLTLGFTVFGSLIFAFSILG